MPKAKTEKAVPALNTKNTKKTLLALRGSDFVTGKKVTVVHKKGGKQCVWTGSIKQISHKGKYAIAEVAAAPDAGYPHPDDGDGTRGTDKVDITVEDANPLTTPNVPVDLYTE
jgi:hypothetical protein